MDAPRNDPNLINKIVAELKSQGLFDQLRKDCMADVDTKPAYQNLRQRVESTVTDFLGFKKWKPDLSKNQLRDSVRKHMFNMPILDNGVDRILNQVINPKVYSAFVPQVEDAVYNMLGIEKPVKESKSLLNGETTTKEKKDFGSLELSTSLKDLLPTDLDPISPSNDDIDEFGETTKPEEATSTLDQIEDGPFDLKTDFVDDSPPFESFEECVAVPHSDLEEVSADSATLGKDDLMYDSGEPNSAQDAPPIQLVEVQTKVLEQEPMEDNILLNSPPYELKPANPEMNAATATEVSKSQTEVNGSHSFEENGVLKKKEENEVVIKKEENEVVKKKEENEVVKKKEENGVVKKKEEIKKVDDKKKEEERKKDEKSDRYDRSRDRKKSVESRDRKTSESSRSKEKSHKSSSRDSKRHSSRDNRDKDGRDKDGKSSSSKEHHRQHEEKKRDESKSSSSSSRHRQDSRSKNEKSSKDSNQKSKEKTKMDDHKSEHSKKYDSKRSDKDGHRDKQKSYDSKERSSSHGSSHRKDSKSDDKGSKEREGSSSSGSQDAATTDKTSHRSKETDTKDTASDKHSHKSKEGDTKDTATDKHSHKSKETNMKDAASDKHFHKSKEGDAKDTATDKHSHKSKEGDTKNAPTDKHSHKGKERDTKNAPTDKHSHRSKEGDTKDAAADKHSHRNKEADTKDAATDKHSHKSKEVDAKDPATDKHSHKSKEVDAKDAAPDKHSHRNKEGDTKDAATDKRSHRSKEADTTDKQEKDLKKTEEKNRSKKADLSKKSESCKKSNASKSLEPELHETKMVENINPEQSKQLELSATTNSSENIVKKYNKPKIAANIYEIKKIMQLRKNYERLERKRNKQREMKSKEESDKKEAEDEEQESEEKAAKRLKMQDSEVQPEIVVVAPPSTLASDLLYFDDCILEEDSTALKLMERLEDDNDRMSCISLQSTKTADLSDFEDNEYTLQLNEIEWSSLTGSYLDWVTQEFQPSTVIQEEMTPQMYAGPIYHLDESGITADFIINNADNMGSSTPHKMSEIFSDKLPPQHKKLFKKTRNRSSEEAASQPEKRFMLPPSPAESATSTENKCDRRRDLFAMLEEELEEKEPNGIIDSLIPTPPTDLHMTDGHYNVPDDPLFPPSHSMRRDLPNRGRGKRGARRNVQQQQRYDNSDLYKPRPSFTPTRRLRDAAAASNEAAGKGALTSGTK